jgi:anti-sigma B factor antagonist
VGTPENPSTGNYSPLYPLAPGDTMRHVMPPRGGHAPSPTRTGPVDTAPRFTSRFEIDDATRVCVVSLTGNLDSAAVEELHPQVQELVRAGYRRFVFDMQGLEYVGSLGLRLLVGLSNQLKGDGGAAMCELRAGVQSVMEMTKVDQVLPAFATRAEAVEAVRGG